MSLFDDAIALTAQPDHTWLGHTSPAYANMVGPFGGITAAQVLNAVLRHPDRLGEPVSLTVNFCAAVEDGAFTVHPRAVRTNRSTQHWTVEMRQQGQTVVTATVFTALRRDTWQHDEHAMPDAPVPDAVPQAVRKGVAWIERYEMRFIEGAIPKTWDNSESPDSKSRLWVRDVPPRPLDHASLTALSDVFFPRIWRRRATLVPIGTVSMTVYFHADSAQLKATGDGHLLAQAQAQGFRGGYFDQTAQLWNQRGDLLATTHQVVYYKG
jgi:acyl-CoA thioesterase